MDDSLKTRDTELIINCWYLVVACPPYQNFWLHACSKLENRKKSEQMI